ncbi:MAG: NUDIX domain-containing protein [Clostridia bacterium]|nr:NUDIX domain-containing protein [Clostridia bacterium]
MAEIWDIVDKDGHDTGMRCIRGEGKKIPNGLYHPCVEIWVVIDDRLLITQRHPDKHEGLKYDVPGGAVVSGEAISDGAMRELYEEVGILTSLSELVYLGALAVDNVYAASYLLRLDSLPTLTLQAAEVVGYKTVTAEELENMSAELTKGTWRRYNLYKNKLFG